MNAGFSGKLVLIAGGTGGLESYLMLAGFESPHPTTSQRTPAPRRRAIAPCGNYKI
jgi:hypothetical protein